MKRYVLIILLGLTLVLGLGVLHLESERRQMVAFSVPILTYHDVVAEGEASFAFLAIPDTVFAQHLRDLKAAGYETISMQDLAAYTSFRKRRLPEKPIIITFDDTWRGQYELALPLLQKYSYTATFYINSGWVGSQAQFMTWDEVRALQSAGMEIGGHTVHHTELKRDLTIETLEAEIIADKAHIEAEIDTTIDTFAYPYNTFTATAIDMLQTIGYTTARTGPAPTAPATLHTLPSYIISTNQLPREIIALTIQLAVTTNF